jgi:hypothetical protein
MIYLEEFLTSACIVRRTNISFTSITSPYWNALHNVNYNIHRKLVFRKAVGEETWKKILFPSEILVFNLIPLLTIYTWKPHRT